MDSDDHDDWVEKAHSSTSCNCYQFGRQQSTAAVGRVPFVALEPLLVYLPRLGIPCPDDSCKTDSATSFHFPTSAELPDKSAQ